MSTSGKKTGKIVPVLLLIGLVISLSLALWPTFIYSYASIWQGMKIAGYSDSLDEYSAEELKEAHDAADAYNRKIYEQQKSGMVVDENAPLRDDEYSKILNITNDGVMGYIEIPSIGVELPIGHGTSDKVLEVGAGHLYGTSVPIGGDNTHSVITAHTGLQSAKMFTDVDKLKKGDTFSIHVLNEIIDYKVDRIKVVLPEEAQRYLAVDSGKDEVTLYTCTPYGINTHRLLVRGHYTKTETVKNDNKGNTDIRKMNRNNLIKTIILGAIPLIVLIVGLIHIFKKKKKKGDGS